METDLSSERFIISTISAFWSLIGEDLCMEIFKRLPIQTLCRLLCVCKAWNSLISSPFFINLRHSFTLSTTTPPNLKPYLIFKYGTYTLYRPRKEPLVIHFPFPYPDDVKSLNYLSCIDVLAELARFDGVLCVDVIDGVVCVSYSVDSTFDSTILWNPAIHKYVSLPRLPFPLDLGTTTDELDKLARFGCNAIGFGYDISKKDFKVVRIWIPCDSIQRECSSVSATYEVYSAREGVWRVGAADNIKSCTRFFSNMLQNSRTGCFMNGNIHWLLYTPGERLIHTVLMFDCEREEFRTMELPEEIFYPVDRRMPSRLFEQSVEILECGGMLLALVRSLLITGFCVELWKMERYGVASSWKKKVYRIYDGVLSQDGLEYLNGFIIYQPSLCDMEEAMYDPNAESMFRKINDGFRNVRGRHVYEESLFLMDDTEARSYTKDEIVCI